MLSALNGPTHLTPGLEIQPWAEICERLRRFSLYKTFGIYLAHSLGRFEPTAKPSMLCAKPSDAQYANDW